jgi:predicted TIM-barrel fold metal-dependent hydrolase
MRDGFQVIDADRHIMEPEDLYDRYLEPGFRGRVRIGPGRRERLVDGRPVSDNTKAPSGGGMTLGDAYRKAYPEAVAADFDAASNVRDMDREGVDVAVLFPTLGLYIMWADFIEPKLSAAICRAYNNWLSDYCAYDPARLKGVMLLPLQDPSLACEELQRAGRDLGLVGIFWRPNVLGGRTLASADYFPVYERASELGVTVCIHEGARTVLPQAGSDRYSELTRHAACHPFEQMLAVGNFCADGVLERFPELKVAHLEAGCGWLPFWLDRLDEHWERASDRVKTTRELPSFYFKRQCMISTEAGEEFIEDVVHHVGADYLVMATDYPHPDAIGKFPELTVGALSGNAAIPKEVKQKILWDNPARLYGIEAVSSQQSALSSPIPAGSR